MLHILITVVLSILLLKESFAQNVFFESEVNFFDDQLRERTACENCDEFVEQKIQISNTSDEIPQIVIRNTTLSKELYLFIVSKCSYNQNALQKLKAFHVQNPSWKVGVYFIGDPKEFYAFIENMKENSIDNINIKLDIQNKMADQFNVEVSPTYLIANKGKYYKIAGNPDLNKTIQGL